MSHPAFRLAPWRAALWLRAAKGSVLLAALLCFFPALLSPAHANGRDNSGLFDVPGEGAPYEAFWSARGPLPPMPERKSFHYRPHFVEKDGFAEDDLPYVKRALPYPPFKRERYEEPRYEEPKYEPRYGEHEPQEDHAPHKSYAEKRGKGFGRLFHDAGNGDWSIKALQRLGRSMVEEGPPGHPAGNSETPSGYTFFGQFVDHDITFDTTTQLGRAIKGDYEMENARTPELDLDSVYGGGPARTPHLYRLPYIRVGRLISEGEAPRYDLFRTRSAHYYGPAGGGAIALLGDPRNDENIIISQLHAAFVAFHNRTVDILIERDFGRERDEYCRGERSCDTQILAESLPDQAKAKIFAIAQDHVIHFYHRMIAEDFLPWVIGPQHTVNLLKKGRDFFFPHGFRGHEGHPRELHIPVEFAAAAFRYGHSQVRDRYVLREDAEFNLLSDGREGGARAFQPVDPRHLIDWRYFFHLDAEPPYGFNWARRIDPELVRSLHQLAFSNAVARDDVSSLAARNLVRGVTLHLPSGQSVAREVLPALAERGLLGKGAPYRGEPWKAYLLEPDERVAHFLGESETPLWYYILQEASVFGTRTHLHRHLDDEHGYPRTSGDFRHRPRGEHLRRISAKRSHGHGPRRYEEDENGYNGGHRLGPVGAAIVGEVITGLLDHYRETTGKGLDYQPQIKGSSSYLGGYAKRGGERYLIANFLKDAGVADAD